MLEDDRGEAFDGFGDFFKVQIAVAQGDFLGTADISPEDGDGEAAFDALDQGIAFLQQNGIKIGFERFARLVEALDDEELTGDADLRGGEADTFIKRVFDGDEHALIQASEFICGQHFFCNRLSDSA